MMLQSNNSEKINIEMNLRYLKLQTILANYETMAKDIENDNLSCHEYLYRLTSKEVEMRQENRIKSSIKRARFPKQKHLVDFKFQEVPSINKQTVIELTTGNFLADSTNLIFYGKPGLGKTHLAISIGRELCLKGFKVIFFTGCELVQELKRAKDDLALTQYFKKMRAVDLVIIDELGFIPFEKQEADLLFQFISDRYERGSVLITSNLVFSEWEKVFQDKITTAAVIDRLIHYSVILELREDDSFRTKEAKLRMLRQKQSQEKHIIASKLKSKSKQSVKKQSVDNLKNQCTKKGKIGK